MDIQKIIESGILERFAKNELSERESAKIEQLLMEHDELGEELEQIYARLLDGDS
jgi:hypothetical protein